MGEAESADKQSLTQATRKSNAGKKKDDREMVREVIHQMNENAVWDRIQSRDVDPKLINYVAEQLDAGVPATYIANSLGFHGTVDKRWKKIQAYFRQGFRADAEAYLYLQSKRFFKTIEQARVVLDDAFVNGVPVVVTLPGGKDEASKAEVIQVKGATKELAGFIKAYSEAIALPVKLWKEYGAIGEKKDAGMTNPTIVVQNLIQMPSADEIVKHQKEMEAKSKAIEVTSRKVHAEAK